MNIKSYIDSTYLKTPAQARLSFEENEIAVQKVIQEAIEERYKLVMLRPENVPLAKELISKAGSGLLIGTVIDFPEGRSDLETKLKEANKAIGEGADELDFVCNYTAFKNGEIDLVKREILIATEIVLANNKTIKWIIETAALTEKEIIQFSALIKNVALTNFKEDSYDAIFVKSSTGFYNTPANVPNGATLEGIVMMLENASPLPVKAAGGIKSYKDAIDMINLGVRRIGTSSAKNIINGEETTNQY